LASKKAAETAAVYDEVRLTEVPRQRRLEATRGVNAANAAALLAATGASDQHASASKPLESVELSAPNTAYIERAESRSRGLDRSRPLDNAV
jgi:hypothetical protein